MSDPCEVRFLQEGAREHELGAARDSCWNSQCGLDEREVLSKGVPGLRNECPGSKFVRLIRSSGLLEELEF